MAITLATGTALYIASTYGASVNMTALTNAAEAVATLAGGHGVIVGDYLEVSSGWGRLDKRIVRAKTVATNDVTFEGINTADTSKYPATTGTGTIRRITAWTALSQVKALSASGGDIQFADITALDDVVARQVPTIRSAVSMNIEVFDDPTLAWYTTVTTASDSVTPYGLRMNFPNGSKLVANTYWNLLKVPNVTQNAALSTQIALSYAADPVRYST